MDFKEAVIERSHELPVVVDFWAEWCGPCRVLGPVIENLAAQANGRWELVKVNTEQYPELMSEYRIQGIPAVKMFSAGEVVAEFTGALPESQIRVWLEEHLPSKEKEAWVAFKEGLIWPPSKSKVEELIARKAEWQDIVEVEEIVFKAELLAFPDRQPGSWPPQFAAHKDALAWWNQERAPYSQWRQLWEDAAWEELIELLLLALNDAANREAARKSLVLLFALFGMNHAWTKKYRRKFSMALN